MVVPEPGMQGCGEIIGLKKLGLQIKIHQEKYYLTPTENLYNNFSLDGRQLKTLHLAHQIMRGRS